MEKIDVEKIRLNFPILQRKVNGKEVVYLDSAATSLKPKQVIEAVNSFYQEKTANIHRAVHTLSEEATEAYEGARKKVAALIHAHPREVIFTKSATEAVNLIANSFCENCRVGDIVLSTEMEHHSNIVPWQLLMQRKGVTVEYVKFETEGSNIGQIDKEDLEQKLQMAPHILAITHVSNVLGTINPIKEIVKLAHNYGVNVLIDAAQSVPHMPVDVKELDCDFLVFSGHKMCGPSGVGVLYGKRELLEGMQPFLGGGDMIKEVKLDGTTFNELPWKFEAGTPNIEGAIGLGAAVDFLQNIGLENIRNHEIELTKYALEKLQNVKGLSIYGTLDPEKRCGVIAFNLGDIHSHDIAQVLDTEGIEIRSGHHCAQPLIEKLGQSAAARASFYLYNSQNDVDKLCASLEKARKVFGLK